MAEYAVDVKDMRWGLIYDTIAPDTKIPIYVPFFDIPGLTEDDTVHVYASPDAAGVPAYYNADLQGPAFIKNPKNDYLLRWYRFQRLSFNTSNSKIIDSSLQIKGTQIFLQDVSSWWGSGGGYINYTRLLFRNSAGAFYACDNSSNWKTWANDASSQLAPGFAPGVVANTISTPTDTELGASTYNWTNSNSISSSSTNISLSPTGYILNMTSAFDTTLYLASGSDTDFSKNLQEIIINDDPYGDSEDPKDGGGDGSHDQWTDKAGDDPEPTLSLTGTGMVTPYAPTLAQLKSFSRFLWSDAFSADTFKKIFSDPFQAIITCHALPFTVTSGVAVNVAFGNISSDVSMNTLASQYYTIDAGTLNIPEYWGSFFDYSPFTSYMIYLPYVGYKEIRPEDFATGSITVKYIVDAITGAFTVRLLSSKVNGSALYQYTGDMAYSIPLSKSDYSSIISNIVSSAAAIGGGIAALAATGSAAALGSAAVSTVGKVTSSKVQVQRSGSVGGAAGWYASQTPYIIRTRPNPVLASNQNYFVGRPSYQTATLSTLSGYTKVKDIRLSGITGTDSEKAEIESLLKEGVIL